MVAVNQVRDLPLSRWLRLHHPARCCQESEGLTASEVFLPTVNLNFLRSVSCLPALRSLLRAAACLSLFSESMTLGRNRGRGAGATSVFKTLTDWTNPALCLRVSISGDAKMVSASSEFRLARLLSHECGAPTEFLNPRISAPQSDRCNYLLRDDFLQHLVSSERKEHSKHGLAFWIYMHCN